jgi:hypothetical protein
MRLFQNPLVCIVLLVLGLGSWFASEAAGPGEPISRDLADNLRGGFCYVDFEMKTCPDSPNAACQPWAPEYPDFYYCETDTYTRPISLATEDGHGGPTICCGMIAGDTCTKYLGKFSPQCGSR